MRYNACMTREEAIREYLPHFDELDEGMQQRALSQVSLCHAAEHELIHKAGEECKGTIVIVCGSVRAFSDFADRREISLYRLGPYDMCLFSASCAFRYPGVQISLEAEEDTEYLVIPTPLFHCLQEASPRFAMLVNNIMQERFADIFALLNDILTKKLPTRLASLLLDEADRSASDTVAITQERLASHLGSAREVITRTLRYLQDDGLISIGRGAVHIKDRKGLERLASSTGV